MTKSSPQQTTTISSGAAALAGGVAAILALAIVATLRAATGIVSVLDALADTLLEVMPLGIFSTLLTTFGANAKAWFLAGLLLVLIGVGALGGVLMGRAPPRSVRLRWTRAFNVSLFTWAVAALFLVWAAGIREGGQLTGTTLFSGLANVAFSAIAYGFGAVWLLAVWSRPTPAAEAFQRAGEASTIDRRTIVRGGASVAGLVGLTVLGREVWRTRGSEATIRELGVIPEPITPIDQFYIVSKNFRDPSGDGGPDWRFRVDGLVENELAFSRDDLHALGGLEWVSTLNCISNEIGGPLIGTARWEGVPLAAVLELATPQDGVYKAVFQGRDGYTDSITLDKALSDETRLAWGMNGQPLPPEHGAPLRAVVPGLYGIKHCKWLERITLTADDYQGYWQQRDWTDEAMVKTLSSIEVPRDRGVITRDGATLAGIAYGGIRGIDRVKVSVDGGATWTEARITERPGDLAWVIWEHPWTPAAGTHQLLVRATDGTGETQTSVEAPTLPDGASGWHQITVGLV